MKYLFGLLAALCFAVELNCTPFTLLSSPQPLSNEQSFSELLNRTLDMTWSFQDGYFRLSSKHHEAYFEVVFFKTLPDSFTDIQDQFVKGDQGYRYSYRWQKGDWEQVNVFEDKPYRDPDSSSYLIAERRIFQDAEPTQLTQEELAEIVQNKSLLFYTGAGLSAPVVPMMSQVNELLGLDESDTFLISIKNAISDPKKLASSIMTFHNACFFTPPTNAHYALTALAQSKKAQIVTENLDYLHEYTGIKPYRVYAEEVRASIDPRTLQQIDYIICIGLSFDDRGFLGWYKEHNPSGKIIAIDLKQPSYLGDEDFLVQGDLQEIVSGL